MQEPSVDRPTTPSPPRQPAVNMSNEQKELKIKRFRETIDLYMNSAKALDKSRQVSLFITNLERGFSWLGEALKEIGSKNPYTGTEDYGSSEIKEPTADHKEENIFPQTFWDLPNHIQKVKYYRSALSGYIQQFKIFEREVMYEGGGEFYMCLQDSRKAMMECKMWLGWELGRIRDGK